MELQNGRPDNTEGRLEKELRVYDLLDRLGVAYQRVDHEAGDGILSAPDAGRQAV